MALSNDTESRRKTAFVFALVLFALFLLDRTAGAQGRTSLSYLKDTWDEYAKELKGINPTDQGSCGDGVELLGVRSDGVGGIYKLSGDHPFLKAYQAAREAELEPSTKFYNASENVSRLQGKVDSIERKTAEAYECAFNLSRREKRSADDQRRLSECRAEAARLESELPGAQAELRQAKESRDQALKDLLPLRTKREALYHQCEQEAARCP